MVNDYPVTTEKVAEVLNVHFRRTLSYQHGNLNMTIQWSQNKIGFQRFRRSR